VTKKQISKPRCEILKEVHEHKQAIRKSQFQVQDDEEDSDAPSDAISDIIDEEEPTQSEGEEQMVGPITLSDRYNRVRRYLQKKHQINKESKFRCIGRSKTAVKRLRIKGRFVTRPQAYEILGFSKTQLMDNDIIRNLLTEYADKPMTVNSVIKGSDGKEKNIRVYNFQELLKPE
jgi:hypothetical protein